MLLGTNTSLDVLVLVLVFVWENAWFVAIGVSKTES